MQGGKLQSRASHYVLVLMSIQEKYVRYHWSYGKLLLLLVANDFMRFIIWEIMDMHLRLIWNSSKNLKNVRNMKIGNEMKTYKKIIAGVTGIFIGVVQGISVNVMAAEANVQPDAPVVQVSNLQYSYEQMKQDLEILQEKYPEQIQIESLGTTVDGREILKLFWGM